MDADHPATRSIYSTPINKADAHGDTDLIPDEVPAQGRPRALATVDAQIPEAEASRDRWLKVVEALTGANRSCRREKAMLRWAEQRLELLHRSRAILMTEAAGEGGGESFHQEELSVRCCRNFQRNPS